MTPAKLAILEKVFAAEIGGDIYAPRVPGKTLTKLVESGHLEPATQVVSHVHIKGYTLTHMGRIAWCGHCSEDDPS